MPIISGVLKDGAGQPIAGCTIQLKAVNTTSAVIMTTTARVGATAGEYSIDALPARYEVTLAVEDYPPQKVGAIDVYADSPDGSLNDFLTAVRGDYLMPDIMKRFELLAKQSREAADAAKAASQGVYMIKDAAETAASGAALSEKNAAGSALAARTSEINAADSVTKAAASAAAAFASQNAAKLSETNAGQSASNAALSEKNADGSALSAGKSATDAAGHATDAQTAATNAATSATESHLAALSAKQAATTAAADAVAGAVPAAAKQVRTEIFGDVTRAETAATSAEASNAGAKQALEEARLIAKTPGESAYEIWKSQQSAGTDTSIAAYLSYQEGKPGLPGSPGKDGTPGLPGRDGNDGLSAYEIWVTQQPAGTDTSLTAYLEFQKGKSSSATIPAPGEVGSYVLGAVYYNGDDELPDDYLSTGIIAGGYIFSMVGCRDQIPGVDQLRYRFIAIPYGHVGQWKLLSTVIYPAGLFQRIR